MATRLYFHAALFNTTLYPGSYPDVSTELQAVIPAGGTINYSQVGADALTTHKSMTKTKGTTQTSFAVTTVASVTTQNNYFGKFISDPLQGVTQIDANTWTSHVAIAESDLNANYSGAFFCLYVWRPSTNALVGSKIYGWTGMGGFAEPGAINSERLFSGNMTAGASTLATGVKTNDVLICEVWSRATQGAAASYTDSFYYDGATEYVAADQTVVTDIATYIETAQNLNFVTDTVTGTSDYKDILKQRPQQLITNSI